MGAKRIYLDRFWNQLSAKPAAIDEATRQHYAELYARPGAMHSAFNQFAAFTKDAADNKALAAKGKLGMPILALGADHLFGTQMADDVKIRGDRCDRRHHPGFRPLGHGGAAATDD